MTHLRGVRWGCKVGRGKARGVVKMSGIRISRSATAVVHAEGPGGGGSATLCGKGADYIHSTTDDVTCKACIKVLAKQDATEVARHEESLRAGRGAMGHTPPGTTRCSCVPVAASRVRT